MDSLTESLLWCIAQVTLVGLLAWLLCAAVSRWTEPGIAIVPATALAAVVVLTACTFLPWPQWWRFGPRWPTETANVTTSDGTPGNTTARIDQAADSADATLSGAPFDLATDAPLQPDIGKPQTPAKVQPS